MVKHLEIPAFFWGACFLLLCVAPKVEPLAHADDTTANDTSTLNMSSPILNEVSPDPLSTTASLGDIAPKPSSYKFALDLTNDTYVDSKTNYFDTNLKSSEISTVGVGVSHTDGPFFLSARWFYSTQEQSQYFDVPELSREFRAPNYTVWVGRHKENWSSADTFWGMGYWQPRFDWNGFRPTEDGMTGVFFEPDTGSRVKMTAFVSPIFLPETDPSFQQQNGELVSQNPWFHDPPTVIDFRDQLTSVQMSVDMPSYASLALKPSAGYKLDFQETKSASLHVAYAYKPMNTAVLGYDYHIYSDAPNPYMSVSVEPRFDYHHIATVENPVSVGDVTITPSLTYDAPQLSSVPSTWIAQDLAQSWIGSLTANWNINGDPGQNIYGGGMYVYGDQPGDRGENAMAVTQFGLRPQYLSALRVGYAFSRSYARGRSGAYSSEATWDPRLNGWELLNQYVYSWDRAWQASVCADFLGIFSQPTGVQQEGWFALYRSNSMASMDLSYIF